MTKHYRPELWDAQEEQTHMEAQPNIVCDTCGREFLTPRELRIHELTHDDEESKS